MISVSRLIYFGRVWATGKLSKRFLPPTISPNLAAILFTQNCNSRCLTCDFWKNGSADMITTKMGIDLIQQLADIGVPNLILTGGEPLLRTDLFEILATVKRGQFTQIMLQTNGMLLKKYHKEINNSPITRVKVSIDGLESTNDMLRGTPGYFKLSLEGLSLIRGKQVTINTNLTKYSVNELESLIEMVEELGYDFSFNLLDKNLSFFTNSVASIEDIWPEASQVDKIIDILGKKLKVPPSELNYIAKYLKHQEQREPPCYLCFLELYIASNGDVFSGCFVLPSVGSIFQQKLTEILASPGYKDRCEAMLKRSCAGCTCGYRGNLMIHTLPKNPIWLFSSLRRLNKATNSKSPLN